MSSEGFASRIFVLLLHGQVISCTCQEILDEISFVVRALIFKGRLVVRDVVLFEVYRKNSLFFESIPQVRVVLEDPDDDKFLACAKAANAAYIITEDWHLLKLKEWSGIKIVTPERFLRQFGYL